tara:strand:+ start:348 stop:800 length:453 start_codon:yes stop_codon:yes gene_type:complete
MQSSIINHFLLCLDNSLRKYPSEQRERIRRRIIDDFAQTDIFRPLYMEDDDDYVNVDQRAIENEMKKEERILAKQKEYGIKPDEPKKNRWGRSDMHEFVEISDTEAIRRLIAEDPDMIWKKDNNDNTPIDQALLDENKTVISLFKDLGFI